MQFVGRVFSTVSEFYKDINPSTLSGAIDIIVVEDEKGELQFGKLHLFRPQEKVVEIRVNGALIDIPMKVGEAGETFFVLEGKGNVPPEYLTSPIPAPSTYPDAEEIEELHLDAFIKQAEDHQNAVLDKLAGSKKLEETKGQPQIAPLPQRTTRLKAGEMFDHTSYAQSDTEFDYTRSPNESSTAAGDDTAALSDNGAPLSDSEMEYHGRSPDMVWNWGSFPEADKGSGNWNIADQGVTEDRAASVMTAIPSVREQRGDVQPKPELKSIALTAREIDAWGQEDFDFFCSTLRNGSVELSLSADRLVGPSEDEKKRAFDETAISPKQLILNKRISEDSNLLARVSYDDFVFYLPFKLVQPLSLLKGLRGTVLNEKSDSFSPRHGLTDSRSAIWDLSNEEIKQVLTESLKSASKVQRSASTSSSFGWRNWWNRSANTEPVENKSKPNSSNTASLEKASSERTITDKASLENIASDGTISSESRKPKDGVTDPSLDKKSEGKIATDKKAVANSNNKQSGNKIPGEATASKDNVSVKADEPETDGVKIAEQGPTSAKTDAGKKKKPSASDDSGAVPGTAIATGGEKSSETKHTEEEQIKVKTGLEVPQPKQTPKKAQYVKTLRLNSEQLKSLKLEYGANQITFSVTARIQGNVAVTSGTTTCAARIFLWKHDTKIVISDIDGTITKSDALGHLFTIVGKDWTHCGVAGLYSSIVRNGYRILYLTSRAIGQANFTREYLRGVEQGQHQLPDGPVIMSPDRLLTAFHREELHN